ncbi:MAG: glycosyltransferase [Anaerolineae bacterium]|nr:glycosyltransferase [Anaerolineae bacterium]
MSSDEAQTIRFSVIIPTFQRRDLVLRAVQALARQEFDGRFEVIVVVDGSTDGSAEALKVLSVPFPLTVLEQPNRGAAAARSTGVAIARGEILLFLDDDMEADPRLLVEHDRSHHEGADVVLGHIPLHPDTPHSSLSAGISAWAAERCERLTAPGASPKLHDVWTGQLSLSRATFLSVGGFDTRFTHDGSYGNEDVDLGYRLVLAGYKIIFNPEAISWHYYAVQPCHCLRRWRQAGHADIRFALKHPDQAETLLVLNGSNQPLNRYFWRPLAACPLLGPLLVGALTKLSLRLAERGLQDYVSAKLFEWAQMAQYWRGLQEAGGVPRARPLRVLLYHAITDSLDGSAIAAYGIPPDMFRSQLDWLRQAGYHFVNGDTFVHALKGQGGLPRKALLLCFDDCYEDLLSTVLPILEERGIPAIAFAVSGLVGGNNAWDRDIGAPPLRLVDVAGLRELAARGVEIGAHSRTHRPFTDLTAEQLVDEITGAMDDLEAFGLDRPRFLAYPHGKSSSTAQQSAKQAGLTAAFTIDPGMVRPSQDPYCVPRIAVLRGDVGQKFRFKIATAGRLAHPSTALRYLAHGLSHPAKAWRWALRWVSPIR